MDGTALTSCVPVSIFNREVAMYFSTTVSRRCLLQAAGVTAVCSTTPTIGATESGRFTARHAKPTQTLAPGEHVLADNNGRPNKDAVVKSLQLRFGVMVYRRFIQAVDQGYLSQFLQRS